MEHTFQMGYKQGENVFFDSPTNWQGAKIVGSTIESLWGPLWKEKNNKFEEFCKETQISSHFLVKCPMYGIGTINFKLGSRV